MSNEPASIRALRYGLSQARRSLDGVKTQRAEFESNWGEQLAQHRQLVIAQQDAQDDFNDIAEQIERRGYSHEDES